jgi:hypothetical protein
MVLRNHGPHIPHNSLLKACAGEPGTRAGTRASWYPGPRAILVPAGTRAQDWCSCQLVPENSDGARASWYPGPRAILEPAGTRAQRWCSCQLVPENRHRNVETVGGAAVPNCDIDKRREGGTLSERFARWAARRPSTAAAPESAGRRYQYTSQEPNSNSPLHSTRFFCPTIVVPQHVRALALRSPHSESFALYTLVYLFLTLDSFPVFICPSRPHAPSRRLVFFGKSVILQVALVSMVCSVLDVHVFISVGRPGGTAVPIS